MAAPTTTTSLRFKLILLGDFGVGKTTFFHRIRTGHFLEEAHTLGQHMNVCERMLPLRHSRSNRQAQISLWDTAGEERFLSLSSCYFRNADAVLLVYSLQALISFDSLSHWVYVARQYCADADIFLLGNKSDLENRVSEDKAEKFAVEHCASERFKVSAKTGENVERSLQEMVEHLFLKKEFQRSSLQVPLQDVGYYSHCGC
ncbi:ras-related protein Rab-19-like isoform X1 [Sceloporus undulatus]|uniref:ras-related protein Rab-19-like isoform X1 n=1 Tax=Sceloporus undulatus TaxID=8520 RepID=UPI001C4B37C2|nr:ras-related protein Rab-19-like isoform X1 [Sceloporus undulatus]XP_042317474.1 ras-related protein Rab-19-like isoform X1 [Sceloporus undulatus]XP_042317475.1 ras-related protein Rab-19-like isoform X1 [Sceloporus undulatus]XP_042317476.1 ras-related protein Rab-19-like isoform X1 [Sceloporus undulatus]